SLHFVLSTAFVGAGCSEDSSSTDEATGSDSSTLTDTGLPDGSTSSGGLTETSMNVISGNDGTTVQSSIESESSGSSSANGEGSSGAEVSSSDGTATSSSGDGSSVADHDGATGAGDTSSESGDVRESSTSTAQNESGDETADVEDLIVPSLNYILNPYRRTPLAAIVPVRPADVGLNEITEVTVTIRGDGPEARDFTATIDPRTQEFQANFGAPEMLEEGQIGIPIIGLYPDLANHVELRLRDGATVVRSELVI